MPNKTITIEFPEEKLNVLLFFLNREQQSLESLLEEQLDKLYNRTVPKPTRDFIQYQMTGEIAADTEETQEASQGAQEALQGAASGEKESKKETRRSKKQERQAGQTGVDKPDAPKQTDQTEHEQEEESPGMQMGM